MHRTHRHVGWLALPLLVIAGVLWATEPPPPTSVERIDITLSWATFGARSEERYVLTRRDVDYVLRGSVSETEDHESGPSEVIKAEVEGNRSASLVAALLQAMQATPVAADRAMGVLASDAAVRAELRRGNDDPGLDSCPEADAVLARPFRDTAAIGAALAEYYKGGWTDDGPQFEMTVRLSDGKELKADTHAQATPTLPWKVNGTDTWNLAIPRALSDVLPSWSLMGRRMASQPNARTVLAHLLPHYQEALGDALFHCTQARKKG
jgi:hypothetical protein